MRKLAALVIGNGTYRTAGALNNPVHDAEDIAAKLLDCGFTVTTLRDGTYKEMDESLRAFRDQLKDQDVGLFFFAGHGVQVQDENYLVAIDTDVGSELDAKHSSLSLNKVIGTMEAAAPSTNIIILDACRNNPWERRWRRAGPQGLAPVYAPKGTLIAYSTSPGEVAGDGVGRNGAYTEALLQHIDTPEVAVETMFKRVRNTLAATTRQKQTSWEHTSLSGEFFFKLSIASQVKAYGPTALSDNIFVIKPDKRPHQIIQGLKVLTWGVQNKAMEKFDTELLNRASADSLFVLGRNIYQAACGSAHGAVGFIAAFMERTAEMEKDARKALLDGMLFEIFFGPDGELRERPKVGKFNEVFDLQAYEDLAPSFEFIAQCLAPAAGRFYTIPGSGHDLAVTVTVDPDDLEDENLITAVYVDGRDILRKDDDLAVRRNWNESFTLKELTAELSEQMLVPSRLLNITINPPDPLRRRVAMPRGSLVRKPI
ncbi:MAG TPA: caspase family protein [Rhizomicrobium sp.]|nr:caspase family protein [Rhizomicrobium sp.]